MIKIYSTCFFYKNKFIKILIWGVFLFASEIMLAQVRDSTLLPDDTQNQILEDFIQNAGTESSFDYNTLGEDLQAYLKKPLNMNFCTAQDLIELGLLSETQVDNIIIYRETIGPFITIYELQAVPTLDLAAIQRILPYVAVNSALDDYQVPLLEMLARGKNEFFTRWERNLELKRGFKQQNDPEASSWYAGDPNRFYGRYRHTYENRLSYGFTFEKDQGEQFRWDEKTKGFDFWSAHFFLKDYNRVIKAVAIGDFAASMGQGLILFSGFGAGKGSFVTNIKRGGRPLRAFTSVNESDFLRGGGLTVAPFKNLEITAFYSSKKRDANLQVTDTLDIEDTPIFFSSLIASGLHRTASEVADKDVIQHTSMGAIAKWKFQQGHIAVNGLYERFSRPFERNPQPYNQYYFSGSSIFNTSLDYTYIHRNMHFFGETALSQTGAVATVNGLMMSIDRSVNVAMLVRNLPVNYQALLPNVFAETGQGSNETGVYMGIECKPHKLWIISLYGDTWKHPWLRFNSDGPSSGYEYFARLTHFRKREMEAYIQFKYENKQANLSTVYLSPGENTTPLIPNIRTNLRFHLSYKVNKELEMRSRLEWSVFKESSYNTSQGFLIYQDVLYKPVGLPVSFTARWAFFNTDDYDSRIYAYENDILYSFSIPAYYYKGMRYYLNLRYRGIRNISIEGHIGRTWYFNRDVVGSGLDEISTNHRTEARLQVSWRF